MPRQAMLALAACLFVPAAAVGGAERAGMLRRVQAQRIDEVGEKFFGELAKDPATKQMVDLALGQVKDFLNKPAEEQQQLVKSALKALPPVLAGLSSPGGLQSALTGSPENVEALEALKRPLKGLDGGLEGLLSPEGLQRALAGLAENFAAQGVDTNDKKLLEAAFSFVKAKVPAGALQALEGPLGAVKDLLENPSPKKLRQMLDKVAEQAAKRGVNLGDLTRLAGPDVEKLFTAIGNIEGGGSELRLDSLRPNEAQLIEVH